MGPSLSPRPVRIVPMGCESFRCGGQGISSLLGVGPKIVANKVWRSKTAPLRAVLCEPLPSVAAKASYLR